MTAPLLVTAETTLTEALTALGIDPASLGHLHPFDAWTCLQTAGLVAKGWGVQCFDEERDATVWWAADDDGWADEDHAMVLPSEAEAKAMAAGLRRSLQLGRRAEIRVRVIG